MSLKVKISLGALLAVAAFLVIRIGNVFHGDIAKTEIKNTGNAPQVAGASTVDPAEVDSDHDGLPDRLEILYGTDPYKADTDGDGFLDGEEVATGHDPLDPSDNDKTRPGNFGQSNPNLTDKAVNLSISSLISDSGDFDPSQLSKDQISQVVQSVNAQAVLALSVPSVKDSDINIVEDNSPAAVQKYLSVITPVLEENIIAPTKNLSSAVSSPIDVLSRYQTTYQLLKGIPVPSDWKWIHETTLNLLQSAGLSAESLTDDQINSDPIKALYALRQLETDFTQFQAVLNQAAALAKQENISTQDTIFELLKV